MVGKEAQVVLVTLISIMTVKMYELISHAKGWVNEQIAIEVTSAYFRVLHRD